MCCKLRIVYNTNEYQNFAISNGERSFGKDGGLDKTDFYKKYQGKIYIFSTPCVYNTYCLYSQFNNKTYKVLENVFSIKFLAAPSSSRSLDVGWFIGLSFL